MRLDVQMLFKIFLTLKLKVHMVDTLICWTTLKKHKLNIHMVNCVQKLREYIYMLDYFEKAQA